jgi:DNA recombination protein RmuC
LICAALALLVAAVALLVVLVRRSDRAAAEALAARLEEFAKAQERTERALKEEVARSREELAKAARDQRQELAEAFRALGETLAQRAAESAARQEKQLNALAEQLDTFAKASGERLDAVRAENAASAKLLREEVVATLKSLAGTITQSMSQVAEVQQAQLTAFSGQLNAFAKASGERLDAVRAENAASAKLLREEVVATLKSLAGTITQSMSQVAEVQQTQLTAFSGQLNAFAKASGERLDAVRAENAASAKLLREEVVATLNGISEAMARTLTGMAGTQKAQLEAVTAAVSKLAESNEKKLEAVRVTVEGKLLSIQSDNAKQLEQMRQTVDEKLQGTLEKRLGESFKLVSERLEQVHKGLGEMQTLATGVGDLKKVLTNVKTRGTWGEVQLGAMLEQVLTPEQFAVNVATKGGGERVEFAIKLPGQGEDREEVVWLPVDAKFPVEDYQRLVDAQERADIEGIDAAARQLESRVRACARDISEKYLDPPNTTDFGILFLPIEGLFAEVVRRPGLTELVQRESRVVIAGPTTLWALLNSLQMGFRTLAIQKRSSEVWNLLAAVKTEWTKYGDVLDAVHKKLHQASETIERAKTRNRAIGRKLRDVQELPAGESAALLPLPSGADMDEESPAADAEADAPAEESHTIRGLPPKRGRRGSTDA